MITFMLYALNLDNVFASLADSTRRDIIKRLSINELSVSDIARPYKMSLAAISKHLKVLENAKMIIKRRSGKHQLVQIYPQALAEAAGYLNYYEYLWNERMDNLDKLLQHQKDLINKKQNGKH